MDFIVQIVGDANQTEWDNVVPPCLKSETGETQFQGIDRTNMDSTMSEQIEILISKKNCSPLVAMQLLNLTLTGIINETTGEEGIIYNYDANATHVAALMNLPYDVLQIVPMHSEYRNSATGDKPHLADRLVQKEKKDKNDFKWWQWEDWLEAFEDWWDDLVDWFEELFEDFMNLLSNLVVCILTGDWENAAEILKDIVNKVKEVGLALVKILVAAVMAVLEMLLKAALLALIWLLFAFTLSLIVIGFLSLYTILKTINAAFSIDTIMNKNEITMRKGIIESTIGYISKTIYSKDFDMDIPSIYIYYKKGGTTFGTSFNYFSLGAEFPQPEISEDFYDVSEGTEEESEISGLSDQYFILQALSEEDLTPLLAGMGAMMAFVGSLMGIITPCCKIADTRKDYAMFTASLTLASQSFFLFVLSIIVRGLDLTLSLGIGLGLIISAIVAFCVWLPQLSAKTIPTIVSYISLFVSISSYLLSWYEIYNLDEAYIIESVQFILGSITLLIGAAGLFTLSKETRTIISFWFWFICFILGFSFVGMTLYINWVLYG